MPSLRDSLKVVQCSYDSLRHVVNESHTFKIYEPPVQASIILAFTTIATVILGFVIKDFLIPGWIDKRIQKRKGQFLFNQYKVQLFNSAYSLSLRLAEIYRTRSHFLKNDTPRGTFYDYKYRSSVYRLCVLLGWIRAYRIQSSSIVINSDKEVHLISDAISKLETSFADGQGVEMYVANALCTLAKINVKLIEPDTFNKLSVEIDNLIQKFIGSHNIDLISELSSNDSDLFFNDLLNLMNGLSLDTSFILTKKVEVVKEVSVRMGLLYRDWQQAIGDLMLVKSTNGDYMIMGYKAFEEIWGKQGDTDEKKWIQRAEKMFMNLDLNIDEASDSRIAQLKNVYKVSYNLLSILFNIEIGAKPMNSKDFNKIQKEIK